MASKALLKQPLSSPEYASFRRFMRRHAQDVLAAFPSTTGVPRVTAFDAAAVEARCLQVRQPPPCLCELMQTAMKELRIVTLRFGTGRQKRALERWTNPKRPRRACTCEYGLQSCRGESAGVAKRPRERSPPPPGIPHATIRHFFASLYSSSTRSLSLPLPLTAARCLPRATARRSSSATACATGRRESVGRRAGWRVASARRRSRPTTERRHGGPTVPWTGRSAPCTCRWGTLSPTSR
jgi:hypothetical protein